MRIVPHKAPTPCPPDLLAIEVPRALEAADHLSLDVFDTALVRCTYRERDLFRFIEREMVEAFGPSLRGLAASRFEAERRVGQANEAHELVDRPFFERIYATLARVHPAAATHLTRIRARELELESALLRRNSVVHRVYQEALARGKGVLFLSDMYLPRDFIEKILRREGFDVFDGLYVSADVGASKSDGTLFDLVVRDRGLEPSRIVHVGDNPVSDGAMPSRKGIRAILVEAPREQLKRSASFRHLEDFGFHERGLSPGDLTSLGLIAQAEHAHQSADGTSRDDIGFRIGFQVLGPVQLGFASWVAERAEAAKLTHLYFIARDGWVTKHVFDELPARTGKPVEAHYLLASRLALFLYRASEMRLDEMLDEEFADLENFRVVLTVARHLIRLGLDPEKYRARVDASPLGSLQRLITPGEQRKAFRAFVRDLEPELREMLAEHRDAYGAYIDRIGIPKGGRVGLVDVTTSGRTHHGLATLFESRSSKSLDLRGFYNYLANDVLRRYPPGAQLEGFLYDYAEAGIRPPDRDFRALYENLLLGAPSESLVRATRRASGIEFVYEVGRDQTAYERFLRPIHEGAIAYAREHGRLSQSTGVGAPSSDLCLAALKRFFYAPTRSEAGYFRGRVAGTYGFDASDFSCMVPITGLSRLLFAPWLVKRELDSAGWRQGYKATLPGAIRAPIEIWKRLRVA